MTIETTDIQTKKNSLTYDTSHLLPNLVSLAQDQSCSLTKVAMRVQASTRLIRNSARKLKAKHGAGSERKKLLSIIETITILLRENLHRLDTSHLLPNLARLGQDQNLLP